MNINQIVVKELKLNCLNNTINSKNIVAINATIL